RHFPGEAEPEDIGVVEAGQQEAQGAVGKQVIGAGLAIVLVEVSQGLAPGHVETGAGQRICEAEGGDKYGEARGETKQQARPVPYPGDKSSAARAGLKYRPARQWLFRHYASFARLPAGVSCRASAVTLRPALQEMTPARQRPAIS